MNLKGAVRNGLSEIRGGSKGWLIILMLAGVLHLVTATSVFIVGRAGLMPGQFTRDGLGAFASDSFFYQEDMMSLTNKFKNQGPRVWLQSVAPLHVKFYSLSHLPFSHWTSPNVLTIEPLNLFYYLAILWLIYMLAATVFDRSAALIAMSIMAVWPSFLMHTTQMIRDPLLIVATMVFILVVTRWLTKIASFRWSLIATILAVLAVLTIWVVRLAMWDAVRVITAAGLILLIVRHILEKRFFIGPIVTAIILTIAIVVIPQNRTIKKSVQAQQRREADMGRPLIAEKVAQLTIWQRIGKRREAFSNLKGTEAVSSASNVDNEVQFNNVGDLVSYLPRAMAIGLFAPFPNMWFAKGGQVGRTGRLLAGFETLLTYLIECLALIGLWQTRRSLAAWLLAVTTVAGVTALGLIVVNIGSLYRFRYPFLMLMIVFAAGGSLHLLRRRADRQRTSTP